MSSLNASQFDPSYNFSIYGVSYIGNPKPNTAMYVGKKIGSQLSNLSLTERCLVFAENGIEISDSVMKKIKKSNCILFVNNPQFEYANLAAKIWTIRRLEERRLKYLFINGSYISETARIAENSYIEPGCKIGHGVIIGKNAVILAGTVIGHAVIGDGFLSNEHAVIGANGFTMATDEEGNKIRIPSLGKVQISDYVEVGAQNNISRGVAGNTVLEENVKLDALVHVGHDAVLKRNVEVTAGGIIGGFDVVEENVFVGLNVSMRNRISIGANSVIGMGSVVTKSVDGEITVIGNPAKPMRV